MDWAKTTASYIRELTVIADIIHFKKLTTEWEQSIFVSLYKGKGIALERGNYRGLKLLNQVIKVLERVAEKFLRQVHMDDIQSGFLPGCSTTDAIFLYTSYKKCSMPSTRCCTWPLPIWKSIRSCTQTCNLGSSQTQHWGVTGAAHTEHVLKPEAKCVLVATWAKNSVWKWVFTKDLAWAPYCSSRFWKPLYWDALLATSFDPSVVNHMYFVLAQSLLCQ